MHGGEVVAKAEEEGLQRLTHLGIDQGRPSGASGIEQRGDAGASGQTPHLAAPAAENAAGDAGLFRRNGIGLAAGHTQRDQVLCAADGGKPLSGLVALILARALPRSLISQEDACLGVIESAGPGIVDSAPALAERGCCIDVAGPLLLFGAGV